MIKKDITATIIANGFRKSGLFPFTADAISFKDVIKNGQKNFELENTNETPQPETIFRNSDAFINAGKLVNYMEATLGLSLISEFRSSGSEWKGAEKHLSLFEFWKKHSDIIETSATESDNEVIHLSDAELLEGYDYDQLINSIAPKCDNSIETSTIVCHEEGNQFYVEVPEIVVTSPPIQEKSPETSAIVCDEIVVTCPPIEVNSPETSTIVCDEEDNQFYVEESEIVVTCPPNEVCVDHISVMEVDLLPEHISPIKENTEPVDSSVLASALNTTKTRIPAGITPLFRDTIFWPDRIPSKKKVKVEKQRDVPAVLIAEEHIDFLRKKRREKDELEQQKAERKRMRTENQKKKEVEALEKKRKSEITKALRIEKANLMETQKMERKNQRIENQERKLKLKAMQNKKNGKKSAMDGHVMEPVFVKHNCDVDDDIE